MKKNLAELFENVPAAKFAGAAPETCRPEKLLTDSRRVVPGALFFAMDEKQHEADLTEKGRMAISPSDPNAFVLPDLVKAVLATALARTLRRRAPALFKI